MTASVPYNPVSFCFFKKRKDGPTYFCGISKYRDINCSSNEHLFPITDPRAYIEIIKRMIFFFGEHLSPRGNIFTTSSSESVSIKNIRITEKKIHSGKLATTIQRDHVEEMTLLKTQNKENLTFLCTIHETLQKYNGRGTEKGN